MKESDALIIDGIDLGSRLIMGTGKYPDDSQIPVIAEASGARVVTVALRRINLSSPEDNILEHIPSEMKLMANTSGARTAEEAVRIAELARAAGCGNWIKVEVISDSRYLLPDGYETVKAAEELVKRGFTVFPYVNPDLMVGRALKDAGCSAVMPLGAPIGSNRGLRTEEMIGILIEEIDLPIIVDAGIGAPSHACQAMEMGAAACMINTAIAAAGDPAAMATAFRQAIAAGRTAYISGTAAVRKEAAASSPLTGFLYE